MHDNSSMWGNWFPQASSVRSLLKSLIFYSCAVVVWGFWGTLMWKTKWARSEPLLSCETWFWWGEVILWVFFLCFFLFQFYNLTLLNTEKIYMGGKAAVVPLQDTKVIGERSTPRITYFHLVSADGFNGCSLLQILSCTHAKLTIIL